MLLKIILAILATIGALVVLGVVAILVLYFLVARRVTRRVRQSLQEFGALQQKSIDAESFRELQASNEFAVPPMRIHLIRASAKLWQADSDVEEAAEWIESQGFEILGDFRVTEQPESLLKVLLSEDRRLVAVIRRDDLDSLAYVEFCFDLGGCRRGGVSNPPDTTLPLPEGAIGVHYDASLSEGMPLLRKMLSRAKKLADKHHALEVDPLRIEAFFEDAHAAEMDSRIERGGLTTSEIEEVLMRDQQTVSVDEIEHIQWDWQDAIEHFLVEQSTRGVECIDEKGELIVVHDASMSSYLYRRICDFYEMESAIEPEDLKHIERELKTMLRLFKPREAIARFRPLLPESIRFNLVDQVSKPVEADLYLLPGYE